MASRRVARLATCAMIKAALAPRRADLPRPPLPAQREHQHGSPIHHRRQLLLCGWSALLPLQRPKLRRAGVAAGMRWLKGGGSGGLGAAGRQERNAPGELPETRVRLLLYPSTLQLEGRRTCALSLPAVTRSGCCDRTACQNNTLELTWLNTLNQDITIYGRTIPKCSRRPGPRDSRRSRMVAEKQLTTTL